jgi:hypothetical protein
MEQSTKWTTPYCTRGGMKLNVELMSHTTGGQNSRVIACVVTTFHTKFLENQLHDSRVVAWVSTRWLRELNRLS